MPKLQYLTAIVESYRKILAYKEQALVRNETAYSKGAASPKDIDNAHIEVEEARIKLIEAEFNLIKDQKNV